MPARAVEDEERMGTECDTAGDLGQVGVHRRGVDEGQDQPCRGAARRADRAEDIRPLIAGVAGRAGSGAAVARSTTSSTSAIASIRRAPRAPFDLPATLRNSTAVSSIRVIAIPAMPASCP